MANRFWKPGDMDLETFTITINPKTKKFVEFERLQEEDEVVFLPGADPFSPLTQRILDINRKTSHNEILHVSKEKLVIKSSLPASFVQVIENYFNPDVSWDLCISGKACLLPVFRGMCFCLDDKEGLKRSIPDFMISLLLKLKVINKSQATALTIEAMLR